MAQNNVSENVKEKESNDKMEKESKQKRKKIIIGIVVAIGILGALVIPKREQYADGGSVSYTSLTYKIMNWNQTFGRTDREVYFFPKNFKSYDELNTTTHINGFVVQIENDMVVLNNRESNDEIKKFRFEIGEHFDRYDNADELKISDEIYIGFTNPKLGDDGIYTAEHVYGLDWFQDTNYVDEPALMKDSDVFRIQIDGYVQKETGEIDKTKTEKDIENATGCAAYYGDCFEYIKNEDGTYSVYKDNQWIIVEFEEDNEFNIKIKEEQQMVEDAMSGETSEVDENGNLKDKDVLYLEIDPETGEITEFDPEEIPELNNDTDVDHDHE